jgi:hypothetical protein
MPTAKKPAARASNRSDAGATRSSTATRREVERTIARFEKAMEDANAALVALRTDASKDAQVAYRDLSRSLKALGRDAQKANRNMIKNLEKLAAAVTPTASSRSSQRAASTRTASNSGASKPAASRSRSRSTAKKAAS